MLPLDRWLLGAFLNTHVPPPQQPRDPPIAIAPILGRQLDDPIDQLAPQNVVEIRQVAACRQRSGHCASFP